MTSATRNAARKMGWCDALPPEWRTLVHEYGDTGVRQARERGWASDRARTWLEAERQRMQFRPIEARRRSGGRIPAALESLNRFLAERQP